jgi:hypothetical protein
MGSRIFAGLIVAFWVAMMAALVRVEFFPQPLAVDAVPLQRVLAKIFDNPAPADLNVFYQGEDIGSCKVDIAPLGGPESVEAAPATANNAPGYRVRSKMTIKLASFGLASYMRIDSKSVFNPRYEIENFQIETRIGDGRVDVRGDEASRKVKMVFTVGGLREQREFDFDQMKDAGLANAFGLPGLSNFGVLGAGGAAGSADGTLINTRAGQGQTAKTYLSRLKIGEDTQQVYVIESRFAETMWAKIWVNLSGQVLLVETSLGITMKAGVTELEPEFAETAGASLRSGAGTRRSR